MYVRWDCSAKSLLGSGGAKLESCSWVTTSPESMIVWGRLLLRLHVAPVRLQSPSEKIDCSVVEFVVFSAEISCRSDPS